MRLSFISFALATSLLSVGCHATGTSTQNQKAATAAVVDPEAIPEYFISAAYFPANVYDYTKLSEFEALIRNSLAPNVVEEANASALKIAQATGAPYYPIPIVSFLGTQKIQVPAKFSTTKSARIVSDIGEGQVDVTHFDRILTLLEGKARHYPAKFKSSKEQTYAAEHLYDVIESLKPYADHPNASYDILLRALKANIMGRNLDLGQKTLTASLNYAKRLLEMNPNDPEVNLWFGFSLSEGGARAEAAKYLTIAMNAGVQDAYLAMANNHLFSEQKANAISVLRKYKQQFPNDAIRADAIISAIQGGKCYNVWEVAM